MTRRVGQPSGPAPHAATAGKCRGKVTEGPDARRLVMLLATCVGVVLIYLMLLDAFETIVLPRRVSRRLRLAVLVLRPLWLLWRRVALCWRGDRRETYLSFFGPSELILLIAMWVVGLITGFALVLWGLGAQMAPTAGDADLGTALYGSGTTFFTLGLGDILP